MAINGKTIILLGVALLAAIFAAWAVRSWMNAQEPTRVVVEESTDNADGVKVLVAKSNLPTGLIIKSDHLRWQSWPEDNVGENYITQETGSISDFVGNVARDTTMAGAPITATRLVQPGERGFLAAVLHPNMRAISIPVNATSGIAGLIFPGDRVDLIVTHQIAADEGNRRRASETVLTNIRVLAIDQSTDGLDGKPSLAKNVTVEVTPKQAEKVAVARQLGGFSLSLRSLASTDAVSGAENLLPQTPKAGRTYTWDNEVSQLIGGGGLGSQQNVVVMRGTSGE